MTEPQPFDETERQREQFLFPYQVPVGDLTFPQILFDANLQEFSRRVAFVCALEANSKLTPLDAYLQIRKLWLALEDSKQNLLDYKTSDEPPIHE
jgi:hypothetical protein